MEDENAGEARIGMSGIDRCGGDGRHHCAWNRILSFPPGVIAKSVGVTVKADSVAEGAETLGISLSSPTNATLGDASGMGTITNDDGAGAVGGLTVGDVSVAEGDANPRALTLQVSLSEPAASAVTVAYATADASATAPGDYAAKSGTLTLPAGSTTKAFTLMVQPDGAAEGTESFAVNLSAASGATIGDGAATVTIVDDD